MVVRAGRRRVVDMSARIVELSRVAAARSAGVKLGEEALQAEAECHRFEFWKGSSGRRYVHSAFSLVGCPEVPSAVYVLLGCDAGGQRSVLRIARVEHEAPSLNLAEIRHRGARLGASEVHVHFLARCESQRRQIERDLRAAHCADRDGADSASRARH